MKLLSVFLLLALSTSAQPGQTDRDLVRASGHIRRLALVIGNDTYPGNPLHNAVNDARSMKSALEESGFKVQISLNTTQQQMTIGNRFAVFMWSSKGTNAKSLTPATLNCLR